jgi:uncharacterized protein (TIGR04255 family)
MENVNPKYRKPPITEAILDLRVEPRPGASAIEIADALDGLVADFPTRQELPTTTNIPLTQGHNLISFGPATFGISPILGGFRYESADRQRIVQLRRDGFVLSYIGTVEKRYPGWEAFRDEARNLWGRYLKAWRPLAVNRIALRYVNQFDTSDSNHLGLDEFLNVLQVPRPQFLDQIQVAEFGLRIAMPQPDIEAVVILNNAMYSPLMVRLAPALDIDIFQEEINIEPDSENIWERFEQLRTRKNQVFQAWISDAVEKALQPI